MNFVIGKLIGYAEANMVLSRYDVAKLRFMLELILLNTMELTLIAAFFVFIGRATEFFIAAVVLLSVRPFSGGFHFKKYRYCAIFTFAIFAAVILILPDIGRMYRVMEGLLLASIAINIAIAPVSKRNFAHSPKSNFRFKIISTVILLAYSVLLLIARDNLYASMATWMLFIQSTQLIIGKVLIFYERNKQCNN